MRFDDTLETVLAADLGTPYGAQSAWRQLVDLIGRRRVAPERRAMATLREIRGRVPSTVRAASARMLELADPPAELVRMFALDDLTVALPVLRSARISSSEWIVLLPDLSPGARSILRNRRDLSPAVRRALESFGPIDFVLPDKSRAAPTNTGDAEGITGSPRGEPVQSVAKSGLGPIAVERAPAQTWPMEPGDTPVAEPFDGAPESSGAASAGLGREPRDAQAAGGDGPFEIAEVVARIDAFWRNREEAGIPAPRQPALAEQFRFETDAKGVIRWVEGVSRAPVIGLALDSQGINEGSRVDGVAAGAYRRRAAFANARAIIEGESDAAGDWLLSAIPVFDSASGRFSGYRGTARRPRVDERAEPTRPASASTPADSLRQLVHELRTPTNAIAGFAEMIEAQMLGPVTDQYRERAQVIRAQARELLGAIDDLDLAARIDSAALALVPGRLALRPLLSGIVDDLSMLAELRGSVVALPVEDLAVIGDRRAVERLLARLLATLVSASAAGERIGVHTALAADDMIAITIDRPKALADYPGDAVLGIDDEREDATLLGTGFALRLARNLARELGGSLVIEAESLTLRLPAAVNNTVGQAHLN